jgi:hypothetical protein
LYFVDIIDKMNINQKRKRQLNMSNNIEQEVQSRIQAKKEAEKAMRQLLTFSISSYNLNNFHVIEAVQELSEQLSTTYGNYSYSLKEEAPDVVVKFKNSVAELISKFKNISDNVLADVQNALIIGYNEGANVINDEQKDIDYSKVLTQVKSSQELLNSSAKEIGDSVTELGVYKENFTSENGSIVTIKIMQVCEDLLSLISGTEDNDLILSLVALQTLTEMKD